MQAEIATTYPSLFAFESEPSRTSRYSSNVQPSRSRVLTAEEIMAVSGGLGLLGAGIGATLGAVGYGAQSAIGGGFSWGGLGAAMAGGAIAGAFGGATAVGTVWGFNGAMVGGIGGGIAQRYALR